MSRFDGETNNRDNELMGFKNKPVKVSRKSKFDKKNTGLLNFMDFKNTSSKVFYWFIFGLMCLIAIICLFPPVWLFFSSVKSIQELYSIHPTLIPKTFEFDKIFIVWNKLNFFKYYINSVEMALGDIAFSLVFNSLFGFVLSQLKPKGSSFLMALLLWTLLLPNTIKHCPGLFEYHQIPMVAY